MQIFTKRQLSSAITESLFKPIHGRTLGAMKASKLDNGKYKTGSMAGQELPEHINWVYVAWIEKKRDADGPYDQIMCYSIYENGPFLN